MTLLLLKIPDAAAASGYAAAACAIHEMFVQKTGFSTHWQDMKV